MLFWCGSLMFRIVIQDLGFAIWIHLVADASHWHCPGNTVKYLLDKIINFKGVSPMEIRMVLKGVSCSMLWTLSGGVSTLWICPPSPLMHISCACSCFSVCFMTLYGSICVGLCLGNILCPWILQHILKWFLFPHLKHFLPHAGYSLGGWDVLHLLHVLPGPPLKLDLWPLPFLYLKELISYYNLLLLQFHHLICVGWSLFTIISCSLACWTRACIL